MISKYLKSLFSPGAVVFHQFLLALAGIGRIVLKYPLEWDYTATIDYCQLAVTLSNITTLIMWVNMCSTLLIYGAQIKRFCAESRPISCHNVGVVILKSLWMFIESGFQTLVFVLQFLLAFTIIGRTVLLKNPEWDCTVPIESMESFKLSDVAIGTVWALICFLSLISIVHMILIIQWYEARRLMLLTLLWMIPMLIGTFAYFITINWYIWLSWTRNLDSSNQFYQVFPAVFLLVHGFIQIIFIRHLNYNIKSFICLSNVSFNVVMLLHLCTCCVDGLKTSIDASDPVLSTAITVTSPFEVTHRGMALVVFIVSLLSHRCGPHKPIVEVREANVTNNLIINRRLLSRKNSNSCLIINSAYDYPISIDAQVNPVIPESFVMVGNHYQSGPYCVNLSPEIGDMACWISNVYNECITYGDDTPSYNMVASTSARRVPEGGGMYCICYERLAGPQGSSLREELVI